MLESVGGSAASKIGGQLGLSPDVTKQAMEMLSPLLLGGLKKQQAGGQDVESLIQNVGGREDVEDHLDNLGAHVQEGDDAALDLGGILGPGQGTQTAEAMSQKLGIDSGMAKKLILMLAPVILGMLMKKGNQDPNTPTRSSGILSILDRDGDGQVLDDIASMIFSGFGRK